MEPSMNLQEALGVGAALVGVKREVGCLPFTIVPSGYKVEPLTAVLDRPARKKGTVAFQDVMSFVRFVNEHKTTATRMYMRIDDNDAAFEAVLNHHGEEADWMDFTAHFRLAPSPDWRRWMAKNGSEMDQVKFAEHLEDCQAFIVEPNGAELLEMIQTLEGKNNVRFESGVRLQNQRQQLVYEEDIQLKGNTGTTKGKIEVPAIIRLGMAPFMGCARYQVDARLRYRISGQKLTFWYQTINPHHVVGDVAKEMCNAIEDGTGIKPFLGSINQR